MTEMKHLSLLAVGLLFMRSIGFFALLPLPQGVVKKIGLALLLTAFSSSAGMSALPPVENLALVSLFTQELLVGVLLTLPLVVIVEKGLMLGELLDIARGQTSSSVFDPFHGVSLSLLATTFSSGIFMLLLSLGAGEQLLSLFMHSMHAFPLAGALTVSSAELGTRVTQLCFLSIAGAMATVLPFAIISTLIEVGSGLLQKTFPAWSTRNESASLKGTLLFLILAAVALSGDGNTLLEGAISVPILPAVNP